MSITKISLSSFNNNYCQSIYPVFTKFKFCIFLVKTFCKMGGEEKYLTPRLGNCNILIERVVPRYGCHYSTITNFENAYIFDSWLNVLVSATR